MQDWVTKLHPPVVAPAKYLRASAKNGTDSGYRLR